MNWGQTDTRLRPIASPLIHGLKVARGESWGGFFPNSGSRSGSGGLSEDGELRLGLGGSGQFSQAEIGRGCGGGESSDGEAG